MNQPVYRSLRLPAQLTIGLLALQIVLGTVSGMRCFYDFHLLAKLDGPYESIPPQRVLEARDLLASVSLIASSALMLLCGIAFIVWLRRAYDNIVTFGAAPRHGRPWTIFGWVFPVLSFWVPYHLVSDAWLLARPEVEDVKFAPPKYFLAWWVIWVAGNGLSQFTARLMEDFNAASISVELADDVIFIACAVLAIFVVRAVTARHEERGRSLKDPGLVPVTF